MTVTVKRIGRTWSVLVDGKVFEGGFFNRDAAEWAAFCIRKGTAEGESNGTAR